jgi:esterase/lipase
VDDAIEIAKGMGTEVRTSGFSMGGTLAIDAARRHPEISAVEVFAPALKTNPKIENIKPEVLKRIVRRIFPTLPATDLDMAGPVTAHMLSVLDEIQSSTKSTDLGRPISVVTLEGDTFVDNSATEKFFKIQTGSERNITMIPASNHLMHRDVPEKAFNLTRWSSGLKQTVNCIIRDIRFESGNGF